MRASRNIPKLDACIDGPAQPALGVLHHFENDKPSQLLSALDVQVWSWVGGTWTAQKTLLWEREAQTLC